MMLCSKDWHADVRDHAASRFANQTAITLAILEASGSSPALLARITVYLVDIRHWVIFDAIFADMAPHACPARAVVPVPELRHGFLVEIEVIALEKRP
ncbi:MAG: RidA family protein [Rhodanobacter sp.]|jgi:enamine deaminase RidA (YjgF/YER057c/UK114 family)